MKRRVKLFQGNIFFPALAEGKMNEINFRAHTE